MVLGAQVARSGASEAEDNGTTSYFQIRARNNEIFCIRRRNADRSHSVEVFFGPGCWGPGPSGKSEDLTRARPSETGPSTEFTWFMGLNIRFIRLKGTVEGKAQAR